MGDRVLTPVYGHLGSGTVAVYIDLAKVSTVRQTGHREPVVALGVEGLGQFYTDGLAADWAERVEAAKAGKG